LLKDYPGKFKKLNAPAGNKPTKIYVVYTTREFFTFRVNNYLAFRENPTKLGNIIIYHSIYED